MSKESKIALLEGDPKRSVLRLALPVMATMIITSLYNLVDGIWIAGLGKSAIAGIGLITPLWMVINGVSNGLAHGATSSVSRYGSKKKPMAEKAAEHSMVIFIVSAVVLTVVLLFSLKPYISCFDVSGDTTRAAIDYSLPLFIGLMGFLLSCGCAGLMRAEGDTRRPLYACSIGVILNGLLDPVFIYTLDMGAAGAAISTVITSFISAGLMLYWMFVKKNTFYTMRLRRIFRPKWDSAIGKNILVTGIPASMELLVMSFASFVFYSFIRDLGGDHGVGVYSSGYRMYLFNLMPVTSISLASIAIVGTHYGRRDIPMVKRSHNYCCLYATGIAFCITMLMIAFSGQLAQLFALTSTDQRLISGIDEYIGITALCIPFLGIGLPSTFMYLGLGKGKLSLLWTTVNEVVCAVPGTYLLGYVAGWGLTGVWWGFVMGRGLAALLNFCFARGMLRKLAGITATTE